MTVYYSWVNLLWDLCQVEDIDMNSIPASYNPDAGDDVDMKPLMVIPTYT